MSSRGSNLHFVLKIFSLFVILLVVNVIKNPNTKLPFTNNVELHEKDEIQDYTLAAQKIIKTSVFTGVALENIKNQK